MQVRRRAQLFKYGLAVFSTGLSLLLRWPFWPVLGRSSPFLTFIPAVILSAYFGGFWPGLLATLLSAAAADYFVIEPSYSFYIAHTADVFALVLFLLLGTMISILSESLHRTRRRLVAKERRQAGEALRETELRFRQLAENIREIFWIQEDGWARTIYASPIYEQVWGRTCQSLYEQPRSWLDGIHSDDRAAVLAHLDQQRRGQSTDAEFRVVRPDHSLRWVRCRSFPLQSEAGEACRIGGLVEDITERKQAEEALRDSEDRFRGTFENAAVGIAHVDSWHRCVRANEVFCDIVGYPRAEAIGKTIEEVVYPDDLSANLVQFDQVIRGELPRFSMEKRFIRKQGEIIWAYLTVSLQRDAVGQPAYCIVIAQDISERKRLDEQLQHSNSRLELAVRGSKVGIWDVDMPDGNLENGRSTFVNCWEQFGFDGLPSTVNEASPAAIVHPDDRDRVQRADRAYLVGESPEYEVEFRVRHKDESYRWMLSRGVALRDASGKPIRFMGVTIEITKLRLAEEELRRTTALLQAVADGTQDAVYVKDREGRHLMFNAAASRMVGKPIQDVLGRDDTAIFDTESARVVMAHDRRVIESGTAGSEEHELTVGGVSRIYLASKAPYRDAQGNVIGIIGICHDITERKRIEQALRASEQRWRNLTEAIPQLVWSAMPDGSCDYFSAQWTEHTGVSEPELLGWLWLETLHPDDREPTRKFWLDSVAERHPYDVEYRVRRRDGEYRWFKTRGVPIRDSSGTITKWFGTGTDITELRQTQEALRHSNARLELAVRGSSIAIWECDMPDGNIENSHPTLINVWESLGYDTQTSPTDFPSAFALLFHPGDQERVGRELQELFASDRQDYESEYRVRTKDGSTHWHLARGTVLRDPAGKSVRFIGTSADITALKRAEEALRERERQLDSLMGHLPGLAYRALADEHWTALFASKGVEDLTGYPPDEFTSRRLYYADIMLPEDRPATREAVFTALRERRMYEAEHRIRHKDGSIRWIWARGHGVFAPDGSLRFIEGLNLDMTRQKQAEEALRESEEALRMSEQRFRTMASVVPVMIWTTAPDGALDYVNAYLTDYTGFPLEQILSGAWQTALHTDDLPRCLEVWNRSIATNSLYEIEYRIRRADGVFRWHLSRGLPLRDDSGRIIKWFGSTVDIDDQKRAAEALREAKEVAEAANRAKDEFLANVSHEIRTPMNAILGMTELVLDTPLTEDQRRCLKTVKSGADSLLGMINDLLDFSKIEAGKLELDPADFFLRATLGDTLRVLAMRAHKKGLELVSQVQPDVPDALIGDAGRLRQVMLNLVGNAIKFTAEGEVYVRVETMDQPPNDDVGLRFIVRDTGSGISPDKQETIFRAFEQEDTSTTRKYGGTGLGLTIAARLVDLMAGTITVESRPGQGSTFAFTAKFRHQSHPAEPIPIVTRPLVLLHNLPVLIVDDNATNRHILEEWLRGWDLEPTAVGDGLSALNALWHGVASGRPYPLLLLDARMPDTDGLTLAALVRERTELSTTCIILLTSGERSGDPARIRELRIDAHLLKPVQQDELLETIFQVLSQAKGVAEPAASRALPHQATPPPLPSMQPLHVLVAEDNELSAQVIERLLSRQGHSTRLTNNGRKALSFAEEGIFDLLLLDIHMPELDGFQVVQAIRKREQTTADHLPIIALTARSRREDRERCLAAGMDDFVTKPVRPAELWAAIERVIQRRPSGGRNSRELLDASVLLASCGGDSKLLRTMCQLFQSRVPEHMAALRNALSDHDAARLSDAAHKFCGLLWEFSTIAGDRAGSLEDVAARGLLAEAAAILDELEPMVADLVRSVDGLSLEALRANHDAE